MTEPTNRLSPAAEDYLGEVLADAPYPSERQMAILRDAFVPIHQAEPSGADEVADTRRAGRAA